MDTDADKTDATTADNRLDTGGDVEEAAQKPTNKTPTVAAASASLTPTPSETHSPNNATTTTTTPIDPKTTAAPENTGADSSVAAAPPTKAAVVAVPARRRKKKKPKEGPRFPLTGYIRYMNVRRDELRLLQPEATTIEVTKLIGAEWNALADDIKRPYLAAAKIDFERYNLECISYKKTLSEKAAAAADSDDDDKSTADAVKKKPKFKKKAPKPNKATEPLKPAPKPEAPHHTAPPPEQPKPPVATVTKPEPFVQQTPQPPRRRTSAGGNYDIPIFTEEFLEHNKHVDHELRMLRKSKTDLEQQNAVLERHIEHMNAGVTKMESDCAEMARTGAAMEAYLDGLRGTLAQAMAGIPLAGHANGPTASTVEAYVVQLAEMATAGGAAAAGGAGALHRARDVLQSLDLSSPRGGLLDMV